MKSVVLNIYKTFFTVKINNPVVYETMNHFTHRLTHYEWIYNRRFRRMVRGEGTEYYHFDQNEKVYRFTYGLLKNFMLQLGVMGLSKDDIYINYTEPKNVQPLNIGINKSFILRDYQVRYSRAARETPNLNVCLVDAFTGAGKGLISMDIVIQMNKRVAILVLPKYVDKWIEDAKKYTEATDNDICVVKGSSSIAKLAKMKPSEIKYGFFILSIATMREYITAYEEGKLNPEFLKPQDFMEHLGVGVMLNDETHQHFHALLRISLYMNVEKFIGMTATLDSNRESMKKIYNTMFPPQFRISNLVQRDNYVNVEASAYRLKITKGVRYQTARGYNHIEYEHHILKHFKFLKSYLEMIKYYVQTRYIDKRRDGDKALVYVSSVRMSSVLTSYLQEQFPTLNVRRFMEDDPYENIIESDLCVTSTQNGGTAFDVPNLVYVLMTTSMASLQANLQTLGRLRDIKGRDLWYTYIYCLDIKNQVNMHRARRDAIRFTTKQFIYSDYIKTVEN